MLSVTPDVAGPGLFAAFGVSAALLIVLVVLVEALVLWRLGWAGFWRSTAGALVANVASAAVGLIFVVFQPPSPIIFLLVSFAASVLVEAGIFMLFKHDATRENWRASLIANLISYILLALALSFIFRY
jgi:hypothetical protein